MKVLVLFSLVALSLSSHLVGRHITVGEDGTITIIGTEGREIHITKNIYYPTKLDMVLRNPEGIFKKIQVDEAMNVMNVNTMDSLRTSMYHNVQMEQTTQGDILAHLFSQFEGFVNEKTYMVLLEKIQHLVEAGLVNETVLVVLKKIEMMHFDEEFKTEHMIRSNVMSNQLVGKYIKVEQDGTIKIIETEGGEIHIFKNTYYPRTLDMILRNTQGSLKKIQVDEAMNTMDSLRTPMMDSLRTPMYLNGQMDQTTQGDILAHLFRQYEGFVNEETYMILLEKIQRLVESGLVNKTVLVVLKKIEMMNFDEEYKTEQMVRSNVMSNQLVGKYIKVEQDGTIKIVETEGGEIHMHKNTYYPRKLDLILRNTQGIFKKIQVDEAMNVNSMDIHRTPMYLNGQMDKTTQADILAHLFRQYEGFVNEQTYMVLLEKIQRLVESGLVNETVLVVLKKIEMMHLNEEFKTEQMMESKVYPRIMTKDVVYPLENGIERVQEVRGVMPIEEVVPEHLRTLLNLHGDLKFKTVGIQGIWDLKHLTPVQRYQMILQHIREQRLAEQGLEKEFLTEDMLTQKMVHQQIMEQLYHQNQEQSYMTPMTRLMNKMKVLGQQKYNQWAKTQWNVPQQWVQGEQELNKYFVPQQWYNGEQRFNKQFVPQQWMHGQQEYNQHVVPQQMWMQDKFVPQQWTNQRTGFRTLMPHQMNMQQQYQRMMMM